MTNIGQIEDTFLVEDQSWLGSDHGTDICHTLTLDADKFLAAFPTGIVPSGVVLGKITATGLYAPYTNVETHGAGTGVAGYHLYKTTNLQGLTAATAKDQAVPGFWHGDVIEAKLPVGHGLDAAGKADLSLIRYR